MSAPLIQGKKVFIPRPPAKGSFPLDHEGECKEWMVKYMECLTNSQGDSTLCRDISKEYLRCRMQTGLMAKEDWDYLGFPEEKEKEKTIN